MKDSNGLYRYEIVTKEGNKYFFSGSQDDPELIAKLHARFLEGGNPNNLKDFINWMHLNSGLINEGTLGNVDFQRTDKYEWPD